MIDLTIKIKNQRLGAVSIFYLLFILIICHVAHGQMNCPDNPYDLWVHTMNSKKIKGELHTVKVSSIMIHEINDDLGLDPIDIQTKNILQLQFRKKKTLGKGALIGAAVGALGGALIIGFSDRDNSEGYIFRGGYIIFNGAQTVILTTIVGASLGVAIGSSSKRFQIYGDQKLYDRSRYNLVPYQCDLR